MDFASVGLSGRGRRHADPVLAEGVAGIPRGMREAGLFPQGKKAREGMRGVGLSREGKAAGASGREDVRGQQAQARVSRGLRVAGAPHVGDDRVGVG